MVCKVKRDFEHLYDWYTAAYPSSDVADKLDSIFNVSDSMNSLGKICGKNALYVKVKKRKIGRSSV